MRRCFVIMPYGRTETEKKEHSRVYKFLIKTAVEDAGMTCVRSDIEGKGGYIMTNVIDDLANSEIVIADLSGNNWNVAYELGMRHVMHKRGTILICDDKTELPFDIKSLNIFIYPQDWLDQMEELCDKLRKIIEGRLSGQTICDSPVHEKYSDLPEDVINGQFRSNDDASRKVKEQITRLESELSSAYDRVSQLEGELASTHERIEALGLSLDTQEETVDYGKLFRAELENSMYISDAAVAKLRELLDEGNKEGFLDFLGKVLSIGFLDEIDCRNIFSMCRKLGVPAITRRYLEAVTKFYPDNEDLQGLLADEYSKNYHTGELALQMANSIIGVSKKDGEYVLAKNAHVTPRKLACFFNVYLHLKKFDDIIAIGRLLEERFSGKDKLISMVYRNITDAAIRMDDPELAKQFVDKLMVAAPEADLTHYQFARYYALLDDYAMSIREIENCIRLDPSDIDYYFSMGGYICDDHFARNPETMQVEKIDAKETAIYTIPFLVAALETDRSCINRVVDFLRRNSFNGYIQPIVEAYQSGNDLREQLSSLDFRAVEYCMSKSIYSEE